MVTPFAADLEVAQREALLPPAGGAQQHDRPIVARLHVRLEAVQAEVAEGMGEEQAHPLAHVSLPRQGFERRVPEVCVLEPAPEDLGEVVHPGDRTVVVPDHEERSVGVGPVALEEAVEGTVRVVGVDPGVVELAGRDPHHAERRAVRVLGLAEVNPVATAHDPDTTASSQVRGPPRHPCVR